MVSQEVREACLVYLSLLIINNWTAAFSEMVPVLHIVGQPSTIQQKTKPLLHHTLGDGRYVFVTTLPQRSAA